LVTPRARRLLAFIEDLHPGFSLEHHRVEELHTQALLALVDLD
jgi:hypothetical protein